MNLLALSGGGIRAFAAIGALLAAQRVGIAVHKTFDAYTGDSSGALLAYLLACGLTPLQLAETVLDTNFARLCSPVPWPMRLGLAAVTPIKLAGLARWIDRLGLEPQKPLVINTWDCQQDRQWWITNDASLMGPTTTAASWPLPGPLGRSQWLLLPKDTAVETTVPSWGTALTRSMALPGLVADHPRWMDGALAEHPPLAWAPTDSHVAIVNLGYAGLVDQGDGTIPGNILARGLYAYEVTASVNQARGFQRFSGRRVVVEPRVYDVASTRFNLSLQEKEALIQRGYDNTLAQWPAWQHRLYLSG